MQLFALGLNHHTAPLAVREQVAFDPMRLPQALVELTHGHEVREAAILSTCNRTELYCAAEAPEAAAQWLAEYHRLQPQKISPYLYTLPSRDAVRHMFRVASGLDSMVLGEPQILGQMKQAARVAENAGTLGTLLHKLFQKTFAVAKEVRSTTAIGANIVSMAAATVHLAERIFENISEQKVLFIGAGEMVELCAAHFAAQQPKRITVANRTLERGEALAARFSGDAMRLDEIGERLAEYDVIVSCTASPLPIIGLGMAERALRARRHRPMVMVDLAVPRDIEPEIASSTTSSCTRWTTSAPSSSRGWSHARRRWSRPRRSSARAWTASCTGWRRARRCRPSARCATPPSARAGTRSSMR